MPVLVDSDVLIEVAHNKDSDLVEGWKRLADSGTSVLCSPVTVAELWHGVRPREERHLELLFSALIVVPVDGTIGQLAGSYLKRYNKSHAVEIADALVAASAAISQAELWTRNRKHYPMKDLRFYQA